MTDKIQKAAEIIQHEVRKNVGAHIHQEDAERLARELHKLWSERVEIAQLPPGEVAQRMRERYGDMREGALAGPNVQTTQFDDKAIEDDLPAVAPGAGYL